MIVGKQDSDQNIMLNQKYSQKWSKNDKVKRHLNNIKMRLEKSIQIKSTNPMAILEALTQEDSLLLNKSANNHILSA